MIISQTEHGGKWEGGHRVNVSAGRTAATGVMREDGRVANSQTDVYLQDVRSSIGQVTLSSAGINLVKFRIDQLGPRKKPGLKLRAVHLIPA